MNTFLTGANEADRASECRPSETPALSASSAPSVASVSSCKKLYSAGKFSVRNFQHFGISAFQFYAACLLPTVTWITSASAQINTFPASGNVGIGTAAPSQKLQVAGNLFVSGAGSFGAQLLTSANAASDPNGNEAAATSGWNSGYPGGTLTVVGTNNGVTPYAGSYQLKFQAPNNGARFDFPFSVVAGKTYVVSLYAKLYQGSVYPFLYVASSNSGDNLGSSITGQDIMVASSYTNYTLNFVSPVTGVVYLSIRQAADSSPDNISYIDDISIKEAVNGDIYAGNQYLGGSLYVGGTDSSSFSGNLGIGTSAATAKLHVYNGQMHIEGTGTGSAAIDLNTYDLVIGPLHTRSGVANSYYGGIAFNHLLNYGATTAYNGSPGAWVGIRQYDVPGSERDYLVFATKPGTGTSGSGNDIPVERMAIDPFGNVGVGTTSPASRLTVLTTTPLDGTYNTDGTRWLKMMAGTTTAGAYNDIVQANDNAIIYSAGTAASGGLAIAPWSGAPGATGVRIDGNGNVGIGTPSPGAKLDVAGDANIQGNLNVGQYATISTAAPGYMVVAANGGNLYLDAPTSNHVYQRVNGAIIADVSSSGLAVSGAFSATNYVASNGTLTGSATGLTLNAGGTNQNVVVSPSGTGATVLNGNVGIGGANPSHALEVAGNLAGNPQWPDLALDQNAWFNLGHKTGYGYISWFAQGNGTTFVNTHATVAPTAIEASSGTLIFLTSSSTGLGNPSNLTPAMTINTTGVGIGTTPDKPLTVKGTIHATEVVVDTTVAAKDLKVQPTGWADYVFDPNYRNPSLREIEQQIKTEGHLSGVPSSQEVAKKGVNLGQMQAVLLEKIEELTLHVIAQEKRLDEQAAEIKALQTENAALRAR